MGEVPLDELLAAHVADEALRKRLRALCSEAVVPASTIDKLEMTEGCL